MSEFQKRIDSKMRINELEKVVKNLALGTISQKRELLDGFVDWFNINDKTQAILSGRVEEYLKTLQLRLTMDKEAIKSKIEKNRDLIDGAVTSDLDPDLKKMLITNLSKQNESLIERLNE